ncbi:MAG: hypothetical protein V3U13_09680 [Gemmatimonadota bacterium]
MRRTFMDDQFDEWEVYVSGGQPGGSLAARVMFVCISTPTREPRWVKHASDEPAEAEHELQHMDEVGIMDLFSNSERIP